MTCNLKSVGVLIKCQNLFLLCKRSFSAAYYPSYWSVPSGHLEPNEDPKAGAVRELYEETRIALSPNDLQFIRAENGFGLYYYESLYMYYPILDIEHVGYCYFDEMEIISLPDNAIKQELKTSILNLKL